LSDLTQQERTRRRCVKRTVFETALVMIALVLGLEVVHYRNAVLEANVDRKTAWRTVVDLRRRCEAAGAREISRSPLPDSGAPAGTAR